MAADDGTTGLSSCNNYTATEATTTEVTTTLEHETGGTSGGDLCPGDSIASGCCCFNADEPNRDMEVVCNVTFPCPKITLVCGDDSCDDLVPSCAQAVDCALDVLIAGEPAGIRWGYDFGYGFEGKDVILYLSGDGLGYALEYNYADLSAYYDSIDGRQLKDAAFFMTCKELGSAAERFACIEQAAASPDVVSDCAADGFGFDH